jgi:hypothetical protein
MQSPLYGTPRPAAYEELKPEHRIEARNEALTRGKENYIRSFLCQT